VTEIASSDRAGWTAEQVADLKLAVGPVRLRARVRVTPAGLLAIGALVSGILVSVSTVVWTSTSVARRHPLATRLRPG
jgi:hypothetical protein